MSVTDVCQWQTWCMSVTDVCQSLMYVSHRLDVWQSQTWCTCMSVTDVCQSQTWCMSVTDLMYVSHWCVSHKLDVCQSLKYVGYWCVSVTDLMYVSHRCVSVTDVSVTEIGLECSHYVPFDNFKRKYYETILWASQYALLGTLSNTFSPQRQTSDSRFASAVCYFVLSSQSPAVSLIR